MPDSILAVNLLSPHSLLGSFGAIGLFLVMFAETGLLIGIFLPGDSLLFTAGLLCATSASDTAHLSLPTVLIAAAGGALLGAQVGYFIGRGTGPPLLERRNRPKLLLAVGRTGQYLDRYGSVKAVVLGRFIPFVRTLINPVAGITRMNLPTFIVAQVTGGLAWSVGITMAGYALGSRIPSIDKYLLPIVGVVVAISLLPVLAEVRRSRNTAGTAQ